VYSYQEEDEGTEEEGLRQDEVDVDESHGVFVFVVVVCASCADLVVGGGEEREV
jgi:hypothetical protein